MQSAGSWLDFMGHLLHLLLDTQLFHVAGTLEVLVIEGLSKAGISSGSYMTCESKGLGLEETLAHLMTEIISSSLMGLTVIWSVWSSKGPRREAVGLSKALFCRLHREGQFW